ncbi:HNH endonuclease [Phaeobacter sp. JH18-32]|uniref:HNH endonuclease n=1 Tax=Phaeobacter TaxID=302485 RepID=UPI003A8AB68F
MRRIHKLNQPTVLTDNFETWSAEYQADPTNRTKKYRYRHPEIKETLKEETKNKCVYCESKIGHNTPGDVEHKLPSSCRRELHFSWENLTIACTECNRRKLAYYDVEKPFLDPYTGGIEERILHLGPIVSWSPGDAESEISLRTLQLNDMSRSDLILRKTEAIDALNNLVARIQTASDPLLSVLKLKLKEMRSSKFEYSGMIDAICESYGID